MLHIKTIKYILLIYFSLFFFNISFSQFKSHIKLEINELKYQNGKLLVNYNINNSKPKDRIRIWIDVLGSKSETDTIFAKSWSGDINKLIEGGKNKIAIWNIFKDKFEIFDSIKVKISATVENRFYLDNPFILSTIYPGWGDYQIRRRKAYWIYGVLGYGLVGSSIGMYYNSYNNYNNYLDANSIADKDKYFDKSRLSKNISYALLGTAGLVWVFDYIGLLKRTKQIKKQRKKNYQIKETPNIPNLKIVTALSNKKFINTRLTNLEVVKNSEKYIDLDENHCLDAFEKGYIEFELLNKGPAPAVDFYAHIEMLDTLNKILLPKDFLIKRISVNKSRKIKIPIKADKGVKTGIIEFKVSISAKKNIPIDPFFIDIPSMKFKYKEKIHISELISDVDRSIPKLSTIKNKYALIIGNEGYANEYTGLSHNFNVTYARNDAIIFKKYAINILGVKEENITFILDGKKEQISKSLSSLSYKLDKLYEAGEKPELIFYYAGHGLADTVSKAPYIIPVDIPPSDLKNARRVMGLRGTSAKKINARSEMISGNTIVFSASKNKYSANNYNKEKHGLYTYYLLKKIKETRGNINLSELNDYLESEVKKKSLEKEFVEQEPRNNPSIAIKRIWQYWKIR